MSTSLLAQHGSDTPFVLYKSTQHDVAKHVAACEKARKVYLRAMYGFQPSKGHYWGVVRSAVADGSVMTVDIRVVWGKARNGTFDLPFHVFKKDGKVLATETVIENIVGRIVRVTVVGRYNFNGILLSNVSAVELKRDVTPVKAAWISTALK